MIKIYPLKLGAKNKVGISSNACELSGVFQGYLQEKKLIKI